MDFKGKINQIKTWAKENKGKILIGTGLVAGVVVMTMIGRKPKGENIVELNPAPEEDDYGKDLEMHFVDPENGEVLWKELCTESYMNETKDWGMQYENIRKLNGIEEEA